MNANRDRKFVSNVVFSVFAMIGTTFTCTDITTGVHASGTDSTYSTGNPGMLLDQRNSPVYALAHFQAD
jgi:hypothetical protein